MSHHPAFMFAAFATLPQRAISCLWNAAQASGEADVIGSNPS
jgi:hypothetical protein